ncbi:conserved exported hypothetical protein [Rubrivivax sp. A210]|uniref:DUF4399 domain-containing protein n=1 Tax=Rubrivivax sp. A210 TaxID=2772301 RepID=UPI001919EED4|nr:DUF4399 domain-containing protein [Rubrivivax sp. A210]CAD5372099.1 conserved exported hypothetical protein [Rubrivivax sp. A210]
MRPTARLFWAAAAMGLLTAAQAEPLPRDERERACWLQHTRERTRVKLTEPTAVDFSNLRDGQTVYSPFQIDFAIRGMGVVPAGTKHAKAGHHHLLVDTPLPINVGEAIPFNDRHRHFGKGQTGTVLDLPPGRHTLRLLFADHEHRPFFVYSPEITVQVAGPRKAGGAAIEAGCEAWYNDELSRPRPPGPRILVANLRDGEAVVSPFNVRLAADGLGVAPRGNGGPANGHFQLEIMAKGRATQLVDLENGATQANLFLSPGPYVLRVRMSDDAHSKDMAPPVMLNIDVVSQERY